MNPDKNENGEANEEDTSMPSTAKENPVKRVTMSGVEITDTDTGAVREEVGTTAPPTPDRDDSLAREEAPVMDNSEQLNSSTPPILMTKIELLLAKIEKRRKQRMEVSYRARARFIDICLNKVHGENPTASDEINAITVSELRRMRDENKQNGEVGEIFEKAVRVSEEASSNVFYFRDFNEYYLTLKQTYFRRNPTIGALIGVLAYYIISLILFCGIMQTNSTCPRTDGGPAYEGWLTAIYFASVTISTVGYGDVSVIGSGTEDWRAFIGILYMIFAMVVAVTVFSSLSGKALEFTEGAVAPKVARLLGSSTTLRKNEELSAQLRRVWLIKMFELSMYFFLINLLGMVVAMIIVTSTKDGDGEGWSWMTGFYWAVQTTTTIGYGDLDMPFDLRWFNFFFAIIGTTFAASLLGSLADLKSNMQSMRTLFVWETREVSMQLIADMEVDGDNAIDEYEFLVGSLITLKKLHREDVEKIMDKFRKLAGEDQIINQRDIEQHQKRYSRLQISKRDIERYNANKKQHHDRKSYRKSYWENVEKKY